MEFEFLVQGNFSASDVHIEYNPQSGRMPTSMEFEEIIEKAWQNYTEQAQQKGRQAYNGEMIRLVDYELSEKDSTLHLHLGLTDYKEFVGTRDAALLVSKKRTFLANPLGTSVVIVTSDNKILCGKRSANTSINPGRYFLVGGFLVPEDVDDASRPFAGAIREAFEETGIDETSRSDMRCVGLVYDLALPHPEMCFSMRVISDFASIQSLVPLEKEMTNLEAIENNPDDVAAWLKHLYPIQIVGTAAGCLLNHGLQEFGQDWFDQTVSELKEISKLD